jgi:hypothetical protein
MIIEKILTNVTGSFNLDVKEVDLEWIVFSDTVADFSIAVAMQGTLPRGANMIQNGQAAGWLPPGDFYRLGNEWWTTCYAFGVDVSDRMLIGDGGYAVTSVTGYSKSAPVNAQVRWRVKQKFSTNAQKKESENGNPSVDDKITVRMNIELEEVPFLQDFVTGRLVVNSAGQFFNQPPTFKRKIPVFTISRREMINPLNKAVAYTNVVNSDLYYGAPPGTLLMDTITCDYDGVAWSNVTYILKQKTEGWQSWYLDTGYSEVRNEKLINILDDEGVPVSEPAKLNGLGQKLPNQALEGFNVGPFWKYQAKPFSVLALPNPFALITRPNEGA